MIKKNSFLNLEIPQKRKKHYLKDIDKIFSLIMKDIVNEKKTLNVLSKNFKISFNKDDLKRFKKFKKIALIGMGGSILGSEAIYNFFKKKIKKKFFFFNNLDENQIIHFKKKEEFSKTLFIIISKSGNTIETISNIFALNIIKKNSKNLIIISEKRDSFLYSVSQKYNICFIEHKPHIGGRFSVLSEVGLIPAYFMGINLNKIREGLINWLSGEDKDYLKKSIINLAEIINSKKINNLVFLNYSPELEKLLFWAQQLIAESLGKKNKGFFPVISTVPKDHHSLLQLYLDGPRDKIFYFFSLKNSSQKKIKIKSNILKKNFLNNKSLSTIKNAQKNALIKSFKLKKIAFREFKLNNFNEKSFGKFISYFILETIILGKLIKINPYDQPGVETVKIFTKELLT